jgi:hypothetical protein
VLGKTKSKTLIRHAAGFVVGLRFEQHLLAYFITVAEKCPVRWVERINIPCVACFAIQPNFGLLPKSIIFFLLGTAGKPF